MYIYAIKIFEYVTMYSSIIIVIKLFANQYNCVTSILFKRLLKLLS